MTIQPTIGILTALPKEYAAMKALLVAPTDDYVPGRGAGRRYCVGEIPALDGGKHTVVLSMSGVGNNCASSRATLLLEHFQDSVDSIVMVGIAGGAPNPIKVQEHVRLGDIVVSDKGGVVQYGFGKEVATTNGDETTVAFEHRSPPRPPSAYLLESVGLLEAAEIYGDRPWIHHIENTLKRLGVLRPQADTDILVSTTDPTIVIDHPHDPLRIGEHPRLFTGTIASEDILLKNPVKRDYLRDKFGVKAIEMEGSGIADASWNAGVGYLVVRGICDYCDSNKSDDWQMYAAIVAAGYVRALIESMPTNIRPRPDPQDKALGSLTYLSPEQYVQAVKAFSDTTPYLSLHQLLAEEGETQVDSYVPLLLQPEFGPPKTSAVSSLPTRQFSVGYDSLSTKEKESLHTEESQPDDEKKPRLLSVVMSDEHDPPHVLFVGPGGAGKSTLLRQIARLAWDAPGSIGLDRRYLPMVIRLSAFAATEGIVAEKKLREAINKAGEISVLHELPDGFFSHWPLQTGAPWILLFDGLDEVPKEQRVTLIAQLLSLLETIKAAGYRVAITSRQEEFLKQLESRFQKYRVLGFDYNNKENLRIIGSVPTPKNSWTK
jgi:nucleoside phosphorylase/energy-coupling factor transporter ATP-binding protein EcfA2